MATESTLAAMVYSTVSFGGGICYWLLYWYQFASSACLLGSYAWYASNATPNLRVLAHH